MVDLYDELYHVVERLAEAGIEYALCGGLAYSFHVQMRATVDIDLLIKETDFEEVRSALAPLGYEKMASRMVFDNGKMVIDRLTKLFPNQGEYLVLDLLFAEPLGNPSIWEERKSIPWRGLQLTLVSVDGLISLKEGRMSDQDRVDISNLQRKRQER